MQTTKRTQYALRAMINLAEGERKTQSLRSISEKEDISFDYLEKIFSKLEKKGLVISKRGVTGGYFLSSPPEKITLKDIFDAVEESLSIVDCMKMKCPKDSKCRASGAWKEVNKKIEETLSSIKLSDLIK